MVCIDYSSQTVSIGELSWAIIDFGENFPLGGKMRTALSEGERIERNQCVVLHLASAYEWAAQGCPRRPRRCLECIRLAHSCDKWDTNRHPNV